MLAWRRSQSSCEQSSSSRSATSLTVTCSLLTYQRGSIAGSGMGTPSVKVRVSITPRTSMSSLTHSSSRRASRSSATKQKMRNAIENERDYVIPEQHDPVTLLFDNTFFLVRVVVAHAPYAYRVIHHVKLIRTQVSMLHEQGARSFQSSSSQS